MTFALASLLNAAGFIAFAFLPTANGGKDTVFLEQFCFAHSLVQNPVNLTADCCTSTHAKTPDDSHTQNQRSCLQQSSVFSRVHLLYIP